jgi:hypothetical protein
MEFLDSMESSEKKKKRHVHQLIRDGIKQNRPVKAMMDDLVNAGIRADEAMRMIKRHKAR